MYQVRGLLAIACIWFNRIVHCNIQFGHFGHVAAYWPFTIADWLSMNMPFIPFPAKLWLTVPFCHSLVLILVLI